MRTHCSHTLPFNNKLKTKIIIIIYIFDFYYLNLKSTLIIVNRGANSNDERTSYFNEDIPFVILLNCLI